MYVDDLIMTTLYHSDQQLLSISAQAAEAHVKLLGQPTPGVLQPVSKRKVTDWLTVMLVLGWLFDTERMTMLLPEEKRIELLRLLSEWPLVPGGGTVTKGQVWELCGFLQHVVRGLPVGRYFLWRLNCLLQGPAWVDELEAQISSAKKAACAPAPGDDRAALARKQAAYGKVRAASVQRQRALRRKVVKFSDDVVADLALWVWLASAQAGRPRIETPIAALVARKPEQEWWSDASYTAIGGCCHNFGIWWRYDYTAEQSSRLIRSKRTVPGDGSISINLLEMLAMMIMAFVIIIQLMLPPPVPGAAVLLRGDNKSAVGWISKGGSARDPRAAATIRTLGAIQLLSMWGFSSKHIAGKLNIASDGISRWPLADVQANLMALYPDVAWRQVELGPMALQLVRTLLRPDSPGVVWQNQVFADLTATLQRGSRTAA
jgi:hypothetical protein